RVDEDRAGMATEHVVLFVDDGLPWRGISITALPSGTRFQLQPSFVVFIHGIPEGFRVCGVNQHGNSELPALVPHWGYARIVYTNAIPFAVAIEHPKALVYLQSRCSHLYIFLKLLCRARSPLGVVNSFKADIREHDKPARILARVFQRTP